MTEFFEALKSLQGSYSGAYVLFWGLCVLLTGVSLVVAKRRWVGKFNVTVYWLLAGQMVVFAALRPIGIARDDLAYLEIYNGICSTLTCHQWMQGARDWGWYSLIGLLKSFWADSRVMLWAGAAGLLVKFGVIYRLARQPLLALVLFTGLFYQVLDLTAWRIALASTVFMIGLLLLIERRNLAGWLVTLSCGVFHKQALLSPVVLFGPWFQRRFVWLPLLALPPFLLMLLGYLIDVPALLQRSGFESLSRFAIDQGLDSYMSIQASGGFNGWRMAPVVFYPLVVLYGWLAWDVYRSNQRLYGYSAAALVGSCWILWAFVSLPIVQVRLFEFLILPVVFLAGACRFDGWRIAGVVAVSGIFVVKYNILHPLLTGGF